jgi:hypothetical protein
MAHTHSQDLEARFNTLQSNFAETQQEVRQLSDNISTINKNMISPIATSIKELKEELKQDITTQLEYVASMICTKLHIPADHPLSDPPLNIEVETSSHSYNFHPHHFQRDLRLPRVDMNKFDGSDPTGWVTQMEHYFSLYDIIDHLAKLWYGVLHLDQECWKRWQWRKTTCQKGMLLGHTLWQRFTNALTLTPTIGHLTNLKQSCTVEDFITSFE